MEEISKERYEMQTLFFNRVDKNNSPTYVQVKKDTSLTFDMNESKYLGFSKELSGKFLRITLKICSRQEKITTWVGLARWVGGEHNLHKGRGLMGPATFS